MTASATTWSAATPRIGARTERAKHRLPHEHPNFSFADSVDLVVAGTPAIAVQLDRHGRVVIAADGGPCDPDQLVVVDRHDLPKLIAALQKLTSRRRR
jgi:hypothetical protein